MRAVSYSEFGGPEVLRLIDVPDPEPGPGEIVIRVRAVGVNPYDWKVRSGAFGGELPKRTGLEASGTVIALGAGVTDVSPGDAVFGPAAGAAAELAVLRNWALVPAQISLIEAAALPNAVETAARTLDLLAVGECTALVIHGASGAVGQAAVQFALARGARVIGTAGPTRQELVRGLGAEPVVYGGGLAQRIRALAPHGIDAALDAAGRGALPELIAVTGSADRVVSIADYAGAQETGARFSSGGPDERRPQALALAATLIVEGHFRLPVAETFPLEEIATAHARSEAGGSGGKLVLTVD